MCFSRPNRQSFIICEDNKTQRQQVFDFFFFVKKYRSKGVKAVKKQKVTKIFDVSMDERNTEREREMNSFSF